MGGSLLDLPRGYKVTQCRITLVTGSQKILENGIAAGQKALSTARLRGRLELEAAMRIGGVRLLAFLLLFLALMDTNVMVTPNKALFSINSFIEQVPWAVRFG